MGLTCSTLSVTDSAVIRSYTDRELVHGPQTIVIRPACCYSITVVDRRELFAGQYMLVRNTRDPSKSSIVHGPRLYELQSPWEVLEGTRDAIPLKINQFLLIEDTSDPARNTYVKGPLNWMPDTLYQRVGSVEVPLPGGGIERRDGVQNAVVLDASDYIIVTSRDGTKRTLTGPAVFVPTYGDSWTYPALCVTVPINNYIVVEDTANHDQPLRHVRGPCKHYNQPFERVIPPSNRSNDFLRECYPVNSMSALWVQRTDGHIHLVQSAVDTSGRTPGQGAAAATPASNARGATIAILPSAPPDDAGDIAGVYSVAAASGTPAFFMPEVGEKVLKQINKTVLLPNSFAIIVGVNGVAELKRGDDPRTRAFFLPPYYTTFMFEVEGSSEKLESFTLLPVMLTRTLTSRTNDNVELEVKLQVQFEVTDPQAFAARPLNPIHTQVLAWVQKELLSAYARLPFRDFLTTYQDACLAARTNAAEHFSRFGIKILDVQVASFNCVDARTQALLQTDVQTRVAKQNELRAAAVDVDVQSQRQALVMKQKELELAVAVKNVDILKQRQEAENGVELMRVQLAVAAELKRKDLVEAQRHNAVLHCRFEGQGAGEYIAAFLEALPVSMTAQAKQAALDAHIDLVRQAMLYSKARITLTSGGATTTNLTLRSDATGDALLKAQPLFLPSLLGYDVGGRVATAAAAAGNEDGGFVALGPLGGSAGIGAVAVANVSDDVDVAAAARSSNLKE